MSQSSKPTFAPRCCKAQARFTDTVDLPTPPLPLATATIRRMPGTLCCCAHGLCGAAACGAPGWFTSTCTRVTPGNAFNARSLSDLIWLATSGLLVVSCIETLTAPSLAAICFTRPNETMSRL